MNEIIERVAKALENTRHLAIGASLTNKNHMAVWDTQASECVADGFADDKAAADGIRTYRARAVIEAMREPTEAMQRAGFLANVWTNTAKIDVGRVTMPADEAWQAMIDAALAES